MDTPFISILTPSFNRAGFITQAVESVCAQEGASFEHIIVDGASTDGTLEALRPYAHLQVTSAPDRGMYDAINKGIALARGEVLAWLNTDDLYPPGAFAAVAQAFAAHPEALALSGAAETFMQSASGEQVVRHEAPITQENFWFRIVNAPVPNGWFFRRAVFDQVGLFDPSYRLVADRQFLIRLALAGIRPVPVEQVLYRYRMHAGSATFQAQDSRHALYGPRRMEVNREDLRMLAGFLGQAGLPGEVRRVMRLANSEYAYRLCATALYHRRGSLAWEGLQAGLRRDALFLPRFLGFALRRMFKRSGHG